MPEQAVAQAAPGGRAGADEFDFAADDDGIVCGGGHNIIKTAADGGPVAVEVLIARDAGVADHIAGNEIPAAGAVVIAVNEAPLADIMGHKGSVRHLDRGAESDLDPAEVQSAEIGGAVVAAHRKANAVKGIRDGGGISDDAAKPIAVILFDQIKPDLVGAIGLRLYGDGKVVKAGSAFRACRPLVDHTHRKIVAKSADPTAVADDPLCAVAAVNPAHLIIHTAVGCEQIAVGPVLHPVPARGICAGVQQNTGAVMLEEAVTQRAPRGETGPDEFHPAGDDDGLVERGGDRRREAAAHR